jgi:ABC-type multidrug transport system fused ATPase/permease subunit
VMRHLKRLLLLATAVVALAVPAASNLLVPSFGLAFSLLAVGAAVITSGKNRQFSQNTLRKQCAVTGATAQRLVTATVTTSSSLLRATFTRRFDSASEEIEGETPTQLNAIHSIPKYDRDALRIRTVTAC